MSKVLDIDPVLYLNDYWNLAQEYMPLNNTMSTISYKDDAMVKI